MKKAAVCLGVLSAMLSPVLGQVRVELAFQQDEFLPGESVTVTVRVINHSGQTLHLGTTPDWLSFEIERQPEGIVPAQGNAPVLGAFDLQSSKVAIKRVDLAPYFALTDIGRYRVTAIVKIPSWGVQVVSPPQMFAIIRGAKLWEQTFGVPPARGAKPGPPEVRKYILQEANYLRGELRLYMRVTDEYGARVFRVVNIGRMLSFSQPEAQVDANSDLHVLYQDGPRSFSYTVFTPNGKMILRQTYGYIGDRPHLSISAESKIAVAGGLRVRTDTDLPAPKSAAAAPDIPPLMPPPGFPSARTSNP